MAKRQSYSSQNSMKMRTLRYMTDFLEITLTKSLEFRCDFKSDIYGIHGESIFYPSIRQSGIKIDTGAHGILIPLKT